MLYSKTAPKIKKQVFLQDERVTQNTVSKIKIEILKCLNNFYSFC